jgi:RNA recognition motif-containing protein
MSDQSREKATIFVGGLDSQVTAETLHDAFIPFGEIADISLPKPELCVGRSITCSYVNSMLNLFSRKSSQESHRGFGYVEFSLPEDAHEAIDNMDQSELYGRVIKVNQAKPQKQAGEKLGSKTAIWEQVNKDFLCFRLEADC